MECLIKRRSRDTDKHKNMTLPQLIQTFKNYNPDGKYKEIGVIADMSVKDYFNFNINIFTDKVKRDIVNILLIDDSIYKIKVLNYPECIPSDDKIGSIWCPVNLILIGDDDFYSEVYSIAKNVGHLINSMNIFGYNAGKLFMWTLFKSEVTIFNKGHKSMLSVITNFKDAHYEKNVNEKMLDIINSKSYK